MRTVTKLIGHALILAGVSALPISVARAQTIADLRGRTLSAADFMQLKTIRLWDRPAPGAHGDAPEDVPTLTEFRPISPNGTAVIIAPGGSYNGLAAGNEGREPADWFTTRGVTAFVLKYRLGPAYVLPTPLLDAQRAIRLVRARADDFQVSKSRIGFVGFSAGGHLAALTATLFNKADPNAVELVDRESDRPDFLILGYGAIQNAFTPDSSGKISYCGMVQLTPCEASRLERYLPAKHVGAQSPPTFLYQTSDDAAVPYDDPIAFYRALRQAGVPAEMHLFDHGGHGNGMGAGDPALDNWPMLLEAWLRGRGLLTNDPTVLRGADIARSSGKSLSIDASLTRLLNDSRAKTILVIRLGSQWVEDVVSLTREVPDAREITLRQAAQFFEGIDAPTLRAIAHDLSSQ